MGGLEAYIMGRIFDRGSGLDSIVISLDLLQLIN